MRVFVAGATGAIGIPAVRHFVARGHSVVGTTRSPDKVAAIRALGAEAVVVDGLDRDAVARAVAAVKPDAIVHQMTSLGAASDLRNFDRTFARTNRLRTEGLEYLMVAARESGARRFIAQSFCGWPYARAGAPIKAEDEPLDPAPPRQQRRSLDAIRFLEKSVTGAIDTEGVVLRYGAFYGHDTGVLDRPILQQLRRRHFPLIGDGDGWWSFIHVEDAAAATALAVERAASGIYNIVDDEPTPVREWLPALAAMAGARRPPRMPKWLASIVAGEHVVKMMTEVRAGSNAKAKRELGWTPTYASWRQGFLACLAGPPASSL